MTMWRPLGILGNWRVSRIAAPVVVLVSEVNPASVPGTVSVVTIVVVPPPVSTASGASKERVTVMPDGTGSRFVVAVSPTDHWLLTTMTSTVRLYDVGGRITSTWRPLAPRVIWIDAGYTWSAWSRSRGSRSESSRR